MTEVANMLRKLSRTPILRRVWSQLRRPLKVISSTYGNLLVRFPPVVGIEVFFDTRISYWRKLVWLTAMTSFAFYTVVGWRSVLGDYFNYEVSVSFDQRVSEFFQFPDVTFCNANIVKKSRFCEGDGPWSFNHSGMDVDVCNENLSLDDSSLKKATDDLMAWVALANAEQATEAETMAHQFEETLMGCRFHDQDCSDKRFFKRLSFANCYCLQCVEDENSDFFVVRKDSSPDDRLEIVLDALQEDYLPATLDVGFSVLIHNHGTLPMLSTDAVYVMPGYTTYVGLTVLGQSGLPSPYKNPCRSEWPPHLLPHVKKKSKYNKENCMQICLQVATMQLCGCSSYTWPLLNMSGKKPHAICERNARGKLCVSKVVEGHGFARIHWELTDPDKFDNLGMDHDGDLFKESEARNIEDECRCYRSCEEITYGQSVTFVPFVAKNDDGENFTSSETNSDLSKVVIYFKTYEYDHIQTVTKYDGLQLLSAIGSVNGMYLGLSFFVLVQVFELLAAGFTLVRSRLSDGTP